MVPAREQHGVTLVVAHPSGVSKSPVGNVGREQRVTAIVRHVAEQWFETDSLQNDVAVGIAENFLTDAIASVKAGVGEVVDGNSGFEGNIFETAVAFFFGEVVSSVGDDQSEIARARLIDTGKIDFIEDAMA